MKLKRRVAILLLVLVASLNLSAQAPRLNSGGVVNAATFAPGAPVAPGSIASVFGAGLASSVASADTALLPLTLAGATLQFNSFLAVPKFFASPTQINFQVPWELAGQTQASLTDSLGVSRSSAERVKLAPSAPGIFTMNQTGCGQGSILIASTGELAASPGTFSWARAALPGEFISIFGTGLGPVTNQPPTGLPASRNPLSYSLRIPRVTIGGVPAPVTFSGLAPDSVGVYQVNVQVPLNTPLGNAVPVILIIDEAPSNPVTMAVGNGRGPCVPCGPLPASLLTCRNWITFAPSRPFNPDLGSFPSEVDLRADLSLLYSEGWRGLVTFSLDGTLKEVPRIAKEVGFTMVIAGLFWFDDAQLERERAAALEQVAWIDGFILGNEGLRFRRYTRQRLENEIARLRAETGRPLATCEPHGQYLADPTLLRVGDWVCPTLHPWFDFRTIPEAVQYVQTQYRVLRSAAADRVVVVNETWWPTGGDPIATAAAQVEFFRQLANTDVKFIWGEAFDQFWKTAEGPQGSHWGYHTDTRAPKRIIQDLRSNYTGAY